MLVGETGLKEKRRYKPIHNIQNLAKVLSNLTGQVAKKDRGGYDVDVKSIKDFRNPEL